MMDPELGMPPDITVPGGAICAILLFIHSEIYPEKILILLAGR